MNLEIDTKIYICMNDVDRHYISYNWMPILTENDRSISWDLFDHIEKLCDVRRGWYRMRGDMIWT